MAKPFKFSILIVPLFFMACGFRKEPERGTFISINIDTSQTITLATDWKFTNSFSGMFKDSRSGQEIIFSGDPTTHRKVRLFRSNGEPLGDIALDSVYTVLDDINCLALLAIDSVVLLDERGEYLFILNIHGEVIRHRNLTDKRCDVNDDKYELYPIGSGLTLLEEKLYMGISLLGSCNGKPYYERSISNILNTQRYYQLATGKCQLAQLDPRATINEVRFGASGILSHLTDVPRETIGMSNTAAANGNLFVYGRYCPAIHLMDTSSLDVKRSIPIIYQKGPVGITPPPISENDMNREGNYIRSITKPTVSTVKYDQPSEQYLVTVYHEIPEDTPANERGERGELRDWSLITYDTSFNKTNEYIFSGKEYNGKELLCLKNGTWVMKADHNPKAFKNAKVFHKLILSSN